MNLKLAIGVENLIFYTCFKNVIFHHFFTAFGVQKGYIKRCNLKYNKKQCFYIKVGISFTEYRLQMSNERNNQQWH